MADLDRQVQFGRSRPVDVGIDQGLRSYMLAVYNYMTLGVALTGLAAFFMLRILEANPAVANALFGSPLKWVLLLAPLGFVIPLSFGIHKMRTTTAQVLFFAFAIVMGVSLSGTLMFFTGESVVRTFFITSAAFASLSLYGYTTKRDLSGLGSFLLMGLVGLIIAMIVNIFLASSTLQFIISVGGVLIFAGLTAYDTKKIKEMYYEADGHDVQSRKVIMGALALYLDFINMFVFLLQLLGNRE